MAPSNVYFTNMRTTLNENLLQKLERLVKKAGMLDQIDFDNKFTAIKIHFGEPGNLAYLRPNYSKVLADLIKAQGGRVFLTDCNTLYVGLRKNALDHLDAAYENGYNPFTTGCHVIIADGLKGTDETLVPVDGQYVKEAKIGRALMDADIVISLTHFKGHESRIWRCVKEHRHGRRFQSWKNGDAQCRKTTCRAGCVHWLRYVQKELCPQRHYHRKPQSFYRSQQMRWLRTLYRRLSH